MTPQSWYRRCRLLHCTGALAEFAVHAMVLSGLIILLQQIAPAQHRRTWAITFILISSYFWLRSSLTWHPQRRRQHIQSVDPFRKGDLLQDLASHSGHYPNSESFQQACEEATNWPKPRYPLLNLWFSGLLPLTACICLCSVFWWSDQISIPQWQWSEHKRITLTPPAYLELPSRTLHPEEQDIHAYPGSLLTWDGIQNSDTLSDNIGRHYLPIFSNNTYGFEARVLEELTFTLNDSPNLKVHLLEDHPPVVDWISPPEIRDLEPIQLAFSAKDDHGLHETFITVNGREIEYAGKPTGKKQFSYRWDFIPKDFVNLMGGNIVLKISAYDNDRIKGPKVGLSSALIWEFPGLAPMAKKSLETIEKLKQQSLERMKPNSIHVSARDVAASLQQLQMELEQNPAIPPSVFQMLNTMERQFRPHAQKNNPQASSEEKAQLKRNLDLLSSIEDALSQIIQTVQAAQMVQKLNAMAKTLRQNDQKTEDMQELYRELEEYLKKNDTAEGLAQHLLKKFNEAELSANMGDTKDAAQILEQMAEFMRGNSSPSSNSSGSNPMAEKFQQIMKTLDELITAQQVLKSQLSASSSSISAAAKQLSQKMRSDLRLSKEWESYQNLVQQLKRNNLSAQEQSQLFQELTTPNSPSYKGRDLHQLDQQLSQLAIGKELTRPLSEFSESFQDNLLKLRPQLEQIQNELQKNSGQQFPPELTLQQKDLGGEGQKFSADFRLYFEPILPKPELFNLADQAYRSAQKAHQQMTTLPKNAQYSMGQALMYWLQLQNQLQQLQEQAQNGAGRPQQLSIGDNGELLLQPQGQNGSAQDGDGTWQHRNESLDIALPEDFKNSQQIEEHLRDQLKNAPSEKLRNSFQKYMLDLLQ